MLSVIIPVYNGEKYLEYAVNSVVKQPIKDVEILIVDDGSTDTTSVLCEKLKETYSCVRIFRQENQGVSAARNVGLRSANGQYVLFLDADDFIVPDVLTDALLKRLEQQETDVLMFSSLLSNSRRNRFCVETKLPDGQLNGRQIFPLAGHFGSCLYQKQLLDQYDIWFDEGISMNEDQVFKIKALYMAKRIEISSRFCYVYCNNPKSVMHTLDRTIDRVNAWCCGYTWFEHHLRGRERDVVLSYVQVKIQSRLLLYAQNYIQSGHSEEEMIEELRRQNGLKLLENLTPAGVMQYQQHDLQLFQTDRKAFIQKAKREGIKISLGRLALRIHIVRWVRDRKKYPFTKIPE